MLEPSFDWETFHAIYLDEELGWIFIDTDDNHLIRNDYGIWRLFYKGVSPTKRDSDYNPYLLCEVLHDNKFCFKSIRYRKKETYFKHNCCGCDHHHTSDSISSILENITAEFRSNGVQDTLWRFYFQLIANHRVPFTLAVSNSFFDIISASILTGRFDTRPPNIIFPRLSRRRISELARIRSRVKINDLLWNLYGMEVCVVLDAGMAGNKNTIICLICCPQKGLKPLPLRSYTAGIKRSNYAKLVARIIFDLRKYNITVTSIITDGLKRQIEAL
jgi:hypothetical protein